MAAIDKLYCPKTNKVLLRLDYYNIKELRKLKEQIDLYLEEYEEFK